MSNPTGTRRDILYRNRQGVGLYSIKHIESGQMGMNHRRITQYYG